MKVFKIICFALSFVLVVSGVALATDYVNIGDPASEAAHGAAGWGPPEPGTSGGNWGGIASWPGVCAVMWDASDDNPLAEVNMLFSGGPQLLKFQHLDGLGDDSFDVFVEGVYVGSYADAGNDGEYWYVNGFTVSPAAGLRTVGFVATGTKWAHFDTYGQVAIAGIWIDSGPVPSEKSTWGELKSLYR